MKKISIFSIATIWALSSNAIFAAALVLSFDSGGILLLNNSGVTLTGGQVPTNYDGEIVQVGYFTGATSDNNNFVGTFIPITGEGSANYVANTPFDTTVGDDAAAGFDPNNQFAIRLEVDTTIQTNLPPVGTILSIRVYDRSTVGASSFYVTASNNLWKWVQPTTLADPSSAVNMSFADPGTLRVENRLGPGGISTAGGDTVSPAATSLRTSIPVPEPSSLLLLSIGALVSMKRRRS